MPEEDAFIAHLNHNLALAVQRKEAALSIIKQAGTGKNKPALIASEAAAYLADKAVTMFKQAFEIQPPTKRALEFNQTGLDQLERCERQLARASDLLNHE